MKVDISKKLKKPMKYIEAKLTQGGYFKKLDTIALELLNVS